MPSSPNPPHSYHALREAIPRSWIYLSDLRSPLLFSPFFRPAFFTLHRGFIQMLRILTAHLLVSQLRGRRWCFPLTLLPDFLRSQLSLEGYDSPKPGTRPHLIPPFFFGPDFDTSGVLLSPSLLCDGDLFSLSLLSARTAFLRQPRNFQPTPNIIPFRPRDTRLRFFFFHRAFSFLRRTLQSISSRATPNEPDLPSFAALASPADSLTPFQAVFSLPPSAFLRCTLAARSHGSANWPVVLFMADDIFRPPSPKAKKGLRAHHCPRTLEVSLETSTWPLLRFLPLSAPQDFP